MALDRTFVNDGRSSPYPFLQSPATPPFPGGCVIAAGVCVRGPVKAVVATGASMSAGGVALTMCAVDEDDATSTLCTLSAAPGKYGVSSVRGAYSAWILAGAVPAAAYGSYAGMWKLDPACLEVLGEPVGAVSSLAVNGVAVPLGDVLSIQADGLLGIELVQGGYAALRASVPEGYGGLFDTELPLSYSRVARINNDIPDGTLRLVVTDAGGDSDSATADYVTMDVDFRRADGTASTVLVDDGAAVPDSVRDRLDTFGEAVTVTIHGHKSLPNCYARENDEAKD